VRPFLNAPARHDNGNPELAAMRRAIELARQALGTTSPNPAVGCVILDSRLAVVGEGFTSAPGGPHAEVNALRAAGERARGGIAVVTLEPCNHYGRTPPCTLALISAGIVRVVFAVSDPHPAAGGGADALRAAGVDVESGLLAEDAAPGLESWLGSMELRRAFVTWVYGASLDGRVAAADGTGESINCEEALQDARVRMRAESDVVVGGAGGIEIDGPDLLPPGRGGRQPRRVILDADAETPARAPVFEGPMPVVVAVSDDVDASHLEGRAEIVRIPRNRGRIGLDLDALMKALHERGVCAVLLEGAPALAGSFVAAGLVDRVVAYVAPVLIGSGGFPALGAPGASSIDSAWRFQIDELVRVGTDLRVTARPRRPGPAMSSGQAGDLGGPPP
jgi:diaminohydroxyphosphoribosylaminopyrimidine deaminase / 5-amino-6-(5-phosphoribosylamino)uracil reductase